MKLCLLVNACICVVKLVSKWRCVLIKPGKNTFSNMVSLKVVNGYTHLLYCWPSYGGRWKSSNRSLHASTSRWDI